MVGRYLDSLTVSLRSYNGYPLPENLEEALSLTIDVAGELDLDQLADDAREVVRDQLHRIRQTYSETNWGATGSEAELIIQVSNILSAAGGVAGVWALISQSALRHGRAQPPAGEVSVEMARAAVAKNLNISADSIHVVGIESIRDGHRVSLETLTEFFVVETDSGGVERLTRTKRFP